MIEFSIISYISILVVKIYILIIRNLNVYLYFELPCFLNIHSYDVYLIFIEITVRQA